MQGVVGVINTPFTKSNAIDGDSVRRYVEHYIECGVTGFLVPAIASEVGKLSFEERRFMVETVVDQTRERVPIVGGASAANREERLRNACMLNELGCSGVLVSIPYENDDDFQREVQAVANTNPKYLMIQDWEFQGFGIPVETIERLFREIELFTHLKVEVAPAGIKYTQVLEATGGALNVSGGWASSQMIEGLDRGVDAFMATILPDLYIDVYDRHRSGDREGAFNAFKELLPLLAFTRQHADISIHFNKRMLYRQGIFETPRVREPILPFDSYHLKIADELIDYGLSISKPAKARTK